MSLRRGAALLAAAAAAAAATGRGSKPHLVMFVVDDLGWHNVAWHNPDMITPHSHKLVSEGIELDRSYVFYFCAPTRSSIMSGRFPYHVNQIILGTDARDWDMPREMTAIPAKLKQAGYATHMVGKWHVGSQNMGQTPHGRGFDTSFGYFDGAEDHWTQASGIDATCNHPSEPGSGVDVLNAPMEKAALKLAGWDGGNTIDLWCTDKPCWGRNGSAHYRMGRNGQVVSDLEHYGDYMYSQEAIRVIHAHDPSVPLYFYIAFQNNHEPLEAPDDYIEMYPADWRDDRRWYAGMTTFWDECIGNVTAELRAKAMYDDTLIVMTTDNGGPTYWAPSVEQNRTYPHGGGANNWPLRGSKVSSWEGGFRGVSFVSGGALPARARGTKQSGYVHVTDWYATFCHLAGVDPADPHTRGTRSDGTTFALPPVDSVNLWPLISGDAPASPRTELPLAIHPATQNHSALIVGEYKLLLGQQILSFWQGPAFPNGTEPYGVWTENIVDCGNHTTVEGGCLFNIQDDPSETVDLAASRPGVLKRLKARYSELLQTALRQEDVTALNANCSYSVAHDVPGYGTVCASPPEFVEMLKKTRGFVGPFLP